MHLTLSKIIGGLKNRGVQVFLLTAAYLLVAHHLPLTAHQFLYTISLFIKDLLIWVLPITVGLFIAHTVCSFHHKAPLFIGALVLFEALSNFASVWYAFIGGNIAADFLPAIKLPQVAIDFNALWRLPFNKPTWWSADKGTLLGLLLGFFILISKKGSIVPAIELWKNRAQWMLTHIFSRMIPLFVLGFVARMHQTHILQQVFAHYGMLLVWLLLFLCLYLFLLFLIGNRLSFKGLFTSIKNLLPAGGIAFTSGCSLSTMPWTIAGAAKNLKNPPFAQAIIPATTNIQQIGDCIINSFLCFLIFRHFFGHSPDLFTWMQFSIVFVFARFATAAILGGVIFIMLPIYEAYLGFNAEMIAIILAFNVVLDPLVTSCNVIANGALCRIFERAWIFIQSTAFSFLLQKKK